MFKGNRKKKQFFSGRGMTVLLREKRTFFPTVTKENFLLRLPKVVEMKVEYQASEQ